MNKVKYLLLILFVFLISSNVYAEDINNKDNENRYKIVIEDDADLFTDEEEIKLKDIMVPLTEYGHIAVKTINDNSYGSASSYASNYYHNNFGSESGSLFLIDMVTRKIYIFSDGANYKIINNDKAYIITDNVYKYASYKQYFECTKEALTEIRTLLEGGKILEPMRYISNAILSITISAFVTFGIANIFTKIKPVSEKYMLKNAVSSFEVKEFDIQKVGTHSEYHPSSSSSGGGSSGGGGGGGGGSSGGGGGHSF